LKLDANIQLADVTFLF